MLARLNRFSDFSDDDIHRVVEEATYLTVPEGWAHMVEQTPADKAYLILDGEVSVRRSGEEVARVGAGELIGEMALVNHTCATRPWSPRRRSRCCTSPTRPVAR